VAIGCAILLPASIAGTLGEANQGQPGMVGKQFAALLELEGGQVGGACFAKYHGTKWVSYRM